ncbi:MAG: hypothetical protein ACYTFI_23430, partial [Planctomycetota bacterium]
LLTGLGILLPALPLAWHSLARAAPARAQSVWWEGESPSRTNFPKKTWFGAHTFQSKRNDVLSGGDWLTNVGKRAGPEAFATYEVHAPVSGEYALWTRKFWKHGPFRWRFDREEWRTCGRDCALADSVEIRKHLCVNWVHLGKVKLAKGPHTFELRLLAGPGEQLTACFDCFLLTRRPFTPRGKIKPGESSGRAESGCFAFEPDHDAFKGDALLDLRRLNEKVAGESGFVRGKGLDFVLGSGRPVRFWAVNLSPEMDHDSMEYIARSLAKRGVNMVRFHGPVFDKRARDPMTINVKRIDQLHRFVAALKGQGIYTKLSFYFPLWFDVKPGYGIPGYEGKQNKKPFALLYFDKRMQEIYRTWARALLLTKNPYTGVALAKDPAVAIVEIVNEDSYFFWTFTAKNVPRVQMQKLEREFGKWLLRKHGSVARALTSWGGAPHKNDDPRAGLAAIYDIWHLTEKGHGEGAKRRRMRDQLEFLTWHQRSFYERMKDFFRREIGSKSMISCSNWHTADARILDALERYTYTAGDVIDRHGYIGARHKGPRSSYAIDVVQFNQVDGYPHVISEIGWTNPNRFKAEGPFLCAAYGALQGVDGLFLFAMKRSWEHSMRKFVVEVPTILGQFPAAALMYRRGDVKEAPSVVHEVLDLRALYDFKGSAAVTAQNLDELRKADVPRGGVARGRGVPSIDPLSFFAGRVVRSFGADRSKGIVRDLTRHIDRGKKVVRSVTGELAWDYGRGVVTVDAARCRGAVGFLGKAGRVELGEVAIECANEYASVLVVSLDGKPLSSSRKILVQAVTEDKPYGFSVEGGKVAELGGYPMNVRRISATVTLHRAGRLREAVVLDANGYARGKAKATRAGGHLRIELPSDALYTVVR